MLQGEIGSLTSSGEKLNKPKGLLEEFVEGEDNEAALECGLGIVL